MNGLKTKRQIGGPPPGALITTEILPELGVCRIIFDRASSSCRNPKNKLMQKSKNEADSKIQKSGRCQNLQTIPKMDGEEDQSSQDQEEDQDCKGAYGRTRRKAKRTTCPPASQPAGHQARVSVSFVQVFPPGSAIIPVGEYPRKQVRLMVSQVVIAASTITSQRAGQLADQLTNCYQPMKIEAQPVDKPAGLPTNQISVRKPLLVN